MMSAIIPGVRCLLCGSALDAADVSMHLRIVHEVVPGEPTIADVPAGRRTPADLRPASTQPQPVLVGAP
jgi:hypothetical protein